LRHSSRWACAGSGFVCGVGGVWQVLRPDAAAAAAPLQAPGRRERLAAGQNTRHSFE
jgi:hypothetical protein